MALLENTKNLVYKYDSIRISTTEKKVECAYRKECSDFITYNIQDDFIAYFLIQKGQVCNSISIAKDNSIKYKFIYNRTSEEVYSAANAYIKYIEYQKSLYGENYKEEEYITKNTPIICLTTKTVFSSFREAGREYGIKYQGISDCIKNKTYIFGDFNNKELKWRKVLE